MNNAKTITIHSITSRIDHVTKIPPAHMAAKLPAPKSVKIEISPRCQLPMRVLWLKNTGEPAQMVHGL